MANMISVSFKNNKEEMAIYNYLKSKMSPSSFVKELVESHMKGNNIDTVTGQQNKDVDDNTKKQTKSLKGISSIAK